MGCRLEGATRRPVQRSARRKALPTGCCALGTKDFVGAIGADNSISGATALPRVSLPASEYQYRVVGGSLPAGCRLGATF